MSNEVSSYNTKKALGNALKKIMGQKPISKITINEITTEAKLNRKTFYYHFEDVYSLLKWVFEDEIFIIVKEIDLYNDYNRAIDIVVDYFENNEIFLQRALDSLGREQFRSILVDDYDTIVRNLIKIGAKNLHKELDDSFIDFLVLFYSEAIGGLMVAWLKNPALRNREIVKAYTTKTIKMGLSGIMLEIDDRKLVAGMK